MSIDPGEIACTRTSLAVMVTMYTGVAVNTDIRKGVFDRFRTLPVWQPAPMVGYLLADVLRYALAALVILTVGLVLGFRPQGGVAGTAAAVALLLGFSFALSWVWTWLGLLLRSEKSVIGVSNLVLFPMTFLSNAFVDPRTMPGWLRSVVEVNPVAHVVTAVRALMTGTGATIGAGWVLAWAGGLLLVFGPLSMRAFRRK